MLRSGHLSSFIAITTDHQGERKIIATVIAVAVLIWLGKLASRVGGDAAN